MEHEHTTLSASELILKVPIVGEMDSFWQIDIKCEAEERTIAIPGHLHGMAVAVVIQGIAACTLSPEQSEYPLEAISIGVHGGIFTCQTDTATITATKIHTPKLKH